MRTVNKSLKIIQKRKLEASFMFCLSRLRINNCIIARELFYFHATLRVPGLLTVIMVNKSVFTAAC